MSANPRWVRSGTGADHVLQVELETGPTYALRVRATLGAISHTWEQDFEVSTPGTQQIALVPPSAAFLHALAEDYVTDLSVKVLARDDGGRLLWLANAPSAYLAWPSGRSGSAVVWDQQTMEVEARLGVTDVDLRAHLDDGEVTRVLPPLYATRALSAEDLEE